MVCLHVYTDFVAFRFNYLPCNTKVTVLLFSLRAALTGIFPHAIFLMFFFKISSACFKILSVQTSAMFLSQRLIFSNPGNQHGSRPFRTEPTCLRLKVEGIRIRIWRCTEGQNTEIRESKKSCLEPRDSRFSKTKGLVQSEWTKLQSKLQLTNVPLSLYVDNPVSLSLASLCANSVMFGSCARRFSLKIGNSKINQWCQWFNGKQQHKFTQIAFGKVWARTPPPKAELHSSNKLLFKFFGNKTKTHNNWSKSPRCAQKTLNGAKFSPASASVSVEKLLVALGAQMNLLKASHSCETRLSKQDPWRRWRMSNTCPLHFICKLAYLHNPPAPQPPLPKYLFVLTNFWGLSERSSVLRWSRAWTPNWSWSAHQCA